MNVRAVNIIHNLAYVNNCKFCSKSTKILYDSPEQFYAAFVVIITLLVKNMSKTEQSRRWMIKGPVQKPRLKGLEDCK